MGVASGDRVALVLPDGPEMAVAFLSVSAIATAAPINPVSSQTEFETYFDELRVRWLLTSAPTDSPVARAANVRSVGVVQLTIDLDSATGLSRFANDGSESPLSTIPATDSDTAIVLTTSGTTSRPKIVALTHANLLESAGNIATGLELGPSDRCLDVMPLFHVHGLIGGLLASLAAGASVICPPGFEAPRFFEWVDDLEPTWYTAVPTMHQAILARAPLHRDVIARRPLRFIRSSSAALPHAVRLALEQELTAPVVEAYGMTEASHQIAQNPLPPGLRKPGSVGRPAGARVAILDAGATPVPQGQIGEIAIRGASVITAYERGGMANEQSFAHGWLKTGDSGFIDEDGYVFITGRLKEIINRGGEKVNPREVDEALLTHPGVAQAASFGMPHDTLGQDVAAVVVLRAGITVTERDVREWAARSLAPFKVPARVVFLDQIPKGPTGKIQRNLLAGQLGLHATAIPADPRPAFVAPEGALEEALAALWRQILHIDVVGRDDNFFHLGGDSVLGARLLARVEADLGKRLSFVSLFDRPQLVEMAAAIGDQDPPGLRRSAEASAKAEALRGKAEATDDLRPDPMAPAVPIETLTHESDSEAPLSFGQQRLWFLDQWQPGSSVFNSSIQLRLKGRLNLEALERSLAAIVRRHDVLRTSFPTVDGRPAQHMAPELTLPIVRIDLSGVAPDDRPAELSRRIAAEIERPLDLAQGPLLRATMWELSPQAHTLLIVVHHIVFDGWSRSIFLRELGHGYDRIVSGDSVVLPPLPLQYSDYARWEVASSQAIDRHLTYWKAQLAECPVIDLPADGRRTNLVDVRGKVQARRLPRELAEAITVFSRREGATPFMTFLAGFGLLLGRLASVQDVVVGSPIAGRTSAKLEDLIGFFVKTLILRINLSAGPSFSELVRRVRGVTLNALDHQDFPLQRLVEAVRPARFRNRNPLFDVTINFRNIPEADLRMTGLDIEAFDPPDPASEFGLSVEISNEHDTFAVRMAYQTALFSDERIALMLRQFESVLQQALANPAASIETVSITFPISDAERHKLLVEWNQTQAEYPAHLCLHELVEAQCARSPDATAVIGGDEVVSYATLNARANRLARGLRDRGVGPDVVVGVFLERSVNLVVALLAVLKAGGAYLPLDSSDPVARLKSKVEDAGARLILTEVKAMDRLQQEIPGAVCHDVGQMLRAPGPQDNLPNVAGPDHLAYVIFTSGSTGRPKGVMISHRSVCNHNHWILSAFPLTTADRVLQQSPAIFDVSVWEFFAPLAAGATLVLGSPSRQFDPAECVNVIVRHGATVLQFVPALLGLLLDEPGVSSCRTVRRVISGGAPLTPELKDRFFEHFNDAVLVNGYGPTEACIYAVAGTCARDDRAEIVPIGRPVSNTYLYVLGPRLELLPIGAAGELYIGGAGLARGYINRPDLTAERFLPDPFAAEGGARIYRTGDRVRYLPDGNLEFLGRLDDQVKIHGVRVELQEVEAAIAAHPLVQQVAVVARHDASGESQLVAHYVSREPPLSMMELRRFLRETLPESMVPSAFLRLNALPLTPSGKIDRQSLPAWTPDRASVAEQYEPPRTTLEAQLARIWGEVLDVSPIGIHDDFFALGGHSLLATQVISRVNRELGRSVPVRQLFETATIEAFANAIEGSSSAQPSSGPATIQRARRTSIPREPG